jgi:hypothetical protein
LHLSGHTTSSDEPKQILGRPLVGAAGAGLRLGAARHSAAWGALCRPVQEGSRLGVCRLVRMPVIIINNLLRVCCSAVVGGSAFG